MALDQATWYAKLANLVPSWFFQVKTFQEAMFQALGKLFSTVHSDLDDNITETFIDEAEGSFLDAHGFERTIPRLPGESDALYAPRVRFLSNQSNHPAIKIAIDAILTTGECEVNEDFRDRVFSVRGDYLDRKEIFVTPSQNVFAVVIDQQSPTTIYDSVLSAISRIKAFGTMYRIIVRD